MFTIKNKGGSSPHPPPFEIILYMFFYMFIIINLKNKHLLLARICWLPGHSPLDPHFALDQLGASKQPQIPVFYCVLFMKFLNPPMINISKTSDK
jgi:hypothetical protein